VQSWNPISGLRHSPFDGSTFVGSLFLRFGLRGNLGPKTLPEQPGWVPARKDFLKNMLFFPFPVG
jgi:hypothetical protein